MEKNKNNVLSIIAGNIKNIGVTFKEGDWKTRLSFLIMGFGPIMRKSFARGIAYLLIEVAFIAYMATSGIANLSKLSTLGTEETHMDPNTFLTTYGDNSFLILLYGVLTAVLCVLFITFWRMNIQENQNEEKIIKNGGHIPTSSQDLKSLLDQKFHATLLALPVLGVLVFMVVPIIFMICVAFTNYDSTHQAPSKLFTWVGFENFKQLLKFGGNGMGSTFTTILIWTLVWAFFATFSTYFGGIALALLINKKGVKFKKFWRTIFVMTIAIPQFISLLYVSKMFAADGLINTYFVKWGIFERSYNFWAHPMTARVLIIVINLWIGIPYVMLMATGLLMNIPADLYESARIDGASPWQMFRKITMPYMLFVTGPYLLTSFTGNLNNFNVIYLLSGGGPTSMQLYGGSGYTDLLVTWLYKLVLNSTNYKLAACVGIITFVVVAVTSLIAYSKLPSIKDEEGFQ